MHPRRRGERQDAGHLAPRGVRARDRASCGRATCWSSRSRTRPPARWPAGSPRSAIGAWRRPRSTPRRSASSATSGRGSTATDPPEILASKAPILAPLAAGLPGGYRYLAVRDLAAEIEWAKARRIGAGEYEARAIAEDRDAPLPPDLMAGLYRRYENAKTRAGRIDFEDMLERTIGLIEGDEAIASEVRDRYRWFSVDEFQDTNPLQAALLDAWLGGRDDLAVVGDEDQTIYTFTGATSDYLIGFAARYPNARVVRLETNYRSTPEVLGLANRVLAAGRTSPAEREPGRRATTAEAAGRRACRPVRRRRSAASRPTRRSWPG